MMLKCIKILVSTYSFFRFSKKIDLYIYIWRFYGRSVMGVVVIRLSLSSLWDVGVV
jgi:hypothetical protein